MNPQQYPPQNGQPPQLPQGPYPPQPGPYPPQPPYPQPGQQPAGQPPYPAQPPLPGPPVASPGYNPYAFPGEYETPKAKKGPNKLVVIGILFLALLAIGTIAVVLTGDNKGAKGGTAQQTNQQTTTTSNAGADVVPRDDGQLDLSKKITSSKTLKAQTVKAKLREQINLSSGLSFMVNQVDPYTSPNTATKPADGKKFVVATVVVGNRNQTGNISVSYLDFRLRDKSNALIAGHVTTNEILNNSLASPTELKPGEQLNGKIIFETDQFDSTWVLVHSETYQKTTDNTTFDVIGEITVSQADSAGTSSERDPSADSSSSGN